MNNHLGFIPVHSFFIIFFLLNCKMRSQIVAILNTFLNIHAYMYVLMWVCVFATIKKKILSKIHSFFYFVPNKNKTIVIDLCRSS